MQVTLALEASAAGVSLANASATTGSDGTATFDNLRVTDGAALETATKAIASEAWRIRTASSLVQLQRWDEAFSIMAEKDTRTPARAHSAATGTTGPSGPGGGSPASERGS